MKKLTIIAPDGSRTHLETDITLPILQHAVGGYIESIPHFTTFEGKPCIAWANEEGKLKKLPQNLAATALWNTATGGAIVDDEGNLVDFLVGPIAIEQEI